MTDSDLLREYNAGHTTYTELAQRYGLTRGQVAGRIRRQRQDAPPPKPKLLAFPTPAAKDEKPIDWDAWQDVLRSFQGYVTVAHLADIHFPDHDEQALNMAYRLIARKQPDVIVVGSDTADFSVISSFGADPDTDEAIDDVLFHFRDYWRPHIDNLNRMAPRAVKVFIAGNHEQRIYTHVRQQAPKLRRTVEEAWLNTVRYGGVLWIGHTEELDIGPLLVLHGNRHNEHVAKSLLDDQGYQVHVMAGHVHRTTSYTREGRRYPVTGITSGCLCQLLPAYMSSKGKSMRRRWNHGMAFAAVDTRGTDVFFDNLRFSSVGNKIVVASDGEVLEQAA